MGCTHGARLRAADQERDPVRQLRSGRGARPAAMARVCTALMAVVGLALSGCATAGVTAGQGSGGLTSLRIATSFAINNLDPLQNGFWGSEMGFGDLLMKPDGDGKLSPWLLQSLARTSADVWTLTLRPGIRFQNGDRLDAAALAQTMNYMLANNTALEPELPGAKVAATGPLIVTLTTAQPTASVPSLLANEAMFDIFDTPVYLRLKANPNSLVAARIYTGPYMVTSLTPEQMVMKPNPYYYGPKPKLQQVAVLFIADAQARIDAVERGEADLALYPPEAAARQLRGSSQAYFLTQQPGHAYGGFQLVMNFRSGPLSDVAVRKALQHGINYEQISQQVMGGYYDTPVGLYPASLPYTLHLQYTDTALARSELQNDGWVPGPGGIRVKDGQQLEFTLLTYPQQPDTAPIALAMQSQLRTIGINMQIRQVDDIDTVVQQPTGWQAALDGNTAMDWTDSDPVEPLIAYYTTGGDDNNGGINDPQVNQIAAELEASTSTSRTDALLEQAQRVIVEQNAWSIWVGYKRDAVVASPQLRHYVVPPAALLWTNAYA
jgi:peptide/nickel transport system substrate-binding protein